MSESSGPLHPKKPSFLDAYPDARRRRPAPAPETPATSGTLWKTILAVAIMLIAGVAALYVVKGLQGSAAQSGPLLGEDARVVEMMDRHGGVVDLADWLGAHEGRMLMGMTRQQALSMGDHLKRMGAKRVCAFKGGVIAISIMVELPDAPAQRQAIFDWWQDSWVSYENKVTTDVGQKYLLIYMRP